MARKYAYAIAAWMALAFTPAGAAEATEESNSAGDAVWEAASAAMQKGPTKVDLREQAQLQLPGGYGFVPIKEGKAVMELLGNQTDERFLGLIFPSNDSEWFVTVEYEESGYIKDDDARNWDADELLQSLKDGTEAANEHRKEIGVSPIEVTRWVEPPAYESATHRLIWSAEARDKSGKDDDPTVNYNTYVLGREGYISLNLITSAATVAVDKRSAKELIGAVEFNTGKRYSDFSASTDKVAAYGLAALVGGIAAKKLGLLAMAGVFILKFAKVILIGAVAFGGAIFKFFKGRGNSGTAA